ncbi:MAG: tRNA (adenosine(37)-N6)-threonylcarbamoyltransferase complex transferase subunit TsaD [Ignavibacteriaceae bacterium]|nr:tRNA (adenosine(37)-N6)-threonylcarbamoyltransferase complex transferase subunit TsaD [Ignavibacteriaceae bacterium]
MIVLGIESSCDETSVAVIRDGVLASNLISSQDFHKLYGGVVPELSSRAHLERVLPLVKKALADNNLSVNDLDLIAATAGPGLIGALLVGFIFGKTLARTSGIPFVPVNHIEGHIFSGFLMDTKPDFPFLCLVVSGGHTMLILVESFTSMKILGTTIDDAAGEAFDKVAKMLNLPYPGGPSVQKAATAGNPGAIDFPIARLSNEFDFSFSGVKTSVLRYIQKLESPPDQEMINNIAASFTASVTGALLNNVRKAIKKYKINTITLTGGVAANSHLREGFIRLGEKYGKKVVIPDFQFCGDNAAMIAFRGLSLHEAGEKFDPAYEPFPSFFSKYITG